MMEGVHCAFLAFLKASISLVEVWAFFNPAEMGECGWTAVSEGDAYPPVRRAGHLCFKPGLMLHIKVASYVVGLFSRGDGEDGNDAGLVVQIRLGAEGGDGCCVAATCLDGRVDDVEDGFLPSVA